MLFRTIDGQRMEPLEEVVCELEDEFSGPVIDALSLRRGEVLLLPLTVAMICPMHICDELMPIISLCAAYICAQSRSVPSLYLCSVCS